MNKKGFTLIELLVVIAIIALLLSIVAPALRKAKEQAKIVICASNQHQTLVGVLTYSSDNNGKLPPCISKTTAAMTAAGTPNSWANYLNYHPGAPVADNSGAMFTYLGSYLPNVYVFMCPVSPGSNHTKYMQDLYENPVQVGSGGSLVSYNMYWGGYQFPNIKFIGPTGIQDTRKSAGLMISDAMSFWGRMDLWWLSHRPDRGDVARLEFDPVYSNNVEMLWTVWGTVSDVPKNLKLNAGYTDGNVRRYSSDRETVTHQFTGQVPVHFIPSKWR